MFAHICLFRTIVIFRCFWKFKAVVPVESVFVELLAVQNGHDGSCAVEKNYNTAVV